MANLFTPLQLRNLRIRNRIFVSPMCQYSCSNQDGLANNWHLVHLGSRAVGGAGLVMAEASAVSPEGRISPDDLGIWSAAHASALKPVTDFIRQQGASAAIQLAHAGRKASSGVPWKSVGPLMASEGGWLPIAPSPIAYDEGWPIPRKMDHTDLERVRTEFQKATEFSLMAGFDVVEVHMAHGYLLHEFLSPLTNTRSDEFGGTLANRMRFPLMVAETVRKSWPEDKPVFVRISATDWADGGWNVESAVLFCRELKNIGIDLIDCSTGGLVPYQGIQVSHGYQVPFAERIRRECSIATGAVGLITEAHQAESILRDESADAIFIARELLRSPYWPLEAARELQIDIEWPRQYLRARL